MKTLILIVLAALTANAQQLPDHKLTPGAIRTSDAKELCAPTFHTRPFRHTSQETKNQVYREYGAQRGVGRCKGGCEVDHLLPLELGGLDDIKNLWPQPPDTPTVPGWQTKDKVENWGKIEVCTGKMDLSYVQKTMIEDWTKLYLLMKATTN
jgi:hypothetical protein